MIQMYYYFHEKIVKYHLTNMLHNLQFFKKKERQTKANQRARTVTSFQRFIWNL